MEPRILLADDHSMIRKGIQVLCKLNLGITDVDEVTSCKELMHALAKKKYTHLVLDINLSDGNTLEILPDIRKLYPDIQITILSMQPESVYARVLKQYGIYQYVSKAAPEDQTIRMLRKFFQNEEPFQAQEETMNKGPFSDFTARELEILHYMLKGMGTNEIANALDLKGNTISTVKNRIFEKTGAANFVELKEMADLHKLA
jgi:two-component system, NarL family, invasion response regulator UvrY